MHKKLYVFEIASPLYLGFARESFKCLPQATV